MKPGERQLGSSPAVRDNRSWDCKALLGTVVGLQNHSHTEGRREWRL